jgi:hypothetical protein
MLRLLTIFAMFLVAGTVQSRSQHQAADLQRVAILGLALSLVVETPTTSQRDWQSKIPLIAKSYQ